jgi:hypothetical protein
MREPDTRRVKQFSGNARRAFKNHAKLCQYGINSGAREARAYQVEGIAKKAAFAIHHHSPQIRSAK